MARNRFVEPELVRVPLSDGDFINIKKALTHGEREDMLSAISPHITVGQRRQIDTRHVRTTKVLTYLVSWSLTDHDQPVPYSPDLPEQERIDTIRSLDTYTFDEIHAAIENHEIAADAARAGKKTAIAPSKSKPISESPSGADGGMTTSVN
jgi:hypothetical protein